MNNHVNNKRKFSHTFFQLKDCVNVSFEFFPPSNIAMEQTFWKSIYKLSTIKPKFISITHNINSGGYKKTYQFTKKIKENTNLNVVPHITCTNTEPNFLKNIAQNYWENGIRHVMALRGDINFSQKRPSMYAIDLIYILKKVGNFDISVAAYPEIHPEATNSYSDLIFLKKKIDAGANRAITQFFFDVENYLRFRDKCLSIGIKADIIPGILPIFNFHKLKKFVAMTNVKIPSWIKIMFRDLDQDTEICKIIGAIITMKIINILNKEGIRNFHFYTLNRAEIVYSLCRTLEIMNNEKNF